MGEIFARLIPEHALDWTGERLTTATAGQVEIEHLHRYVLARALCRDLDVLDVAAGEGYGSALLAQTAQSVTGVDVAPDAVAHAARSYRHPNLRFIQGDARRLPVDDASMDVVVSFETIEHLYEHEEFLKEVRRVLRPGGRFIVSTPERDVYSPPGSTANPYHVRELSGAELGDLLRRFFTHVHLFGQRPMIGSALMALDCHPRQLLTFEKRGPRHFEATDGLPRSTYLVAVASDGHIDGVPDSLYIETAEVGATLAASAVAERATAELGDLRARVAAADNAQTELMNLHAEVAAACEQRDIARIAARRAAVSEGQWRGQIAELERRASEAESHYLALRAKIDSLVARFRIRRIARLIPTRARRLVKERLLGPSRQ